MTVQPAQTDLDGAVGIAEHWLAMAETCEFVSPSGVLRYPPICNSEFEAFRTILAALRRQGEDLVPLAEAYRKARAALLRNAPNKEQPNV